MEQEFAQVVLLLAVAVAIIVAFQRLHIPTSLGYLLAGIVVGPFTMGPVVDSPPIHALAEFGIVFLLFTIGLNFSLPQIHALRHTLLGLGTGQIVLTTAIVALVAWLAGLPPAAAFVVGAVFAQSSTTGRRRCKGDRRVRGRFHRRPLAASTVFPFGDDAPFR